jgi:hypothetical protein
MTHRIMGDEGRLEGGEEVGGDTIYTWWLEWRERGVE